MTYVSAAGLSSSFPCPVRWCADAVDAPSNGRRSTPVTRRSGSFHWRRLMIG